MNYHKESLLTAIKTYTLHQHTQQLSLQSPNPIDFHTPFEIYHYDQEGNSFQQLQSRMREQILYKFNEHLYEEECSRLQMELFTLDRAIQIERDQIEYLKLKINACKFHQKAIPLLQDSNPAKQAKLPISRQQQAKTQQKEVKDKASFSIYPCVSVDFDPPKTVPFLPLLKHQQKEIPPPKSHRQTRAIYSRRSHTPSQNIHQSAVQSKDQSVKENKKESEQNLHGIQRQIQFIERAWDEARKQGKNILCKRYKKELMSLISAFWALTNK